MEWAARAEEPRVRTTASAAEALGPESAKNSPAMSQVAAALLNFFSSRNNNTYS